VTQTTTNKRSTFFWGWVTLVIGLIIGGISVFLVDPPTTTQTGTALPWQSAVNDAGQVEVLGLTLGKSTTRDAMALYGKEIEITLFTDAQTHPVSVESFFEDMYIGYTLRGRLVLTLDATTEQLNSMLNTGARVKMTESGAREVELSAHNMAVALDIPIRALTYIPYPKLDEATLKSRFGEPDEVTTGDDGIKRWHYHARKLIILFNDSDRKSLQFGE
jgi:hypothetical protein